jgi:hypothetical protein
MAETVDKAAYTVYLHLYANFKKKYNPGKYKPGFAELLAITISNELFSKPPEDFAEEEFLRSQTLIIKEELAQVNGDNNICRIVSHAAHIMNMMSYASSKSKDPEEVFKRFKYASVSPQKLMNLGIDISQYIPRETSLALLTKMFIEMTDEFYDHAEIKAKEEQIPV